MRSGLLSPEVSVVWSSESGACFHGMKVSSSCTDLPSCFLLSTEPSLPSSSRGRNHLWKWAGREGGVLLSCTIWIHPCKGSFGRAVRNMITLLLFESVPEMCHALLAQGRIEISMFLQQDTRFLSFPCWQLLTQLTVFLLSLSCLCCAAILQPCLVEISGASGCSWRDLTVQKGCYPSGIQGSC